MTIKNPKQARAQTTFNSILEAVVQILSREDSGIKLNTRSIAERAGVSVGSLYQYFKSIDSILKVMAEKQLEKDKQLLLDGFNLAQGTPEQRLEQMFTNFLKDHQRQSKIRSIFLRRFFEFGLYEIGKESLEKIARELLVQVKKVSPTRSDLNEKLAASVLAHALFGITLGFTLDQSSKGQEVRLAKEMTQLLLGYLAPLK